MNSTKKENPWRVILSVILLCVAAAFLYIGVSRGEVPIVLNKAVNICMECIGLGGWCE